MVADIISSEKNPVAKRLLDLGYAGVGSEELLKKEVSFGAGKNLNQGITGITMQISAGHGNDLVGVDPQALIFHKEMYDPATNPTLREEIKKQIRSLDQDFEDLQSGKISSRLRDRIERGVNIDANNWETLRFQNRASAERYRRDAIELQSALLEGRTKIQNIPGLLKTASNMLTRDLYKTERQMDIIERWKENTKC